MIRERALKIVGLIFVGIYPFVMHLWRPGNEPPGDTMMLSLYVALGFFLVLAARNPSAYRSLIAYAGWANFAHAMVALMAIHPASDRRGLLIAVAGFGVTGAVLIAFVPARQSHTVQSRGQNAQYSGIELAGPALGLRVRAAIFRQ
jgi:hypothetical protein